MEQINKGDKEKKQRTKITQCERDKIKIGKWKNKRDKQEKEKVKDRQIY